MKRVIIFLLVLLMLVPALPVTAATYSQGDVNGDGKVSSVDYMLVKRQVLRKNVLNKEQFSAADINGDGRVNAADYMIVKRVVLGKMLLPCLHDYSEMVIGNLHIFTCKKCNHQYEKFDGELIG